MEGQVLCRRPLGAVARGSIPEGDLGRSAKSSLVMCGMPSATTARGGSIPEGELAGRVLCRIPLGAEARDSIPQGALGRSVKSSLVMCRMLFGAVARDSIPEWVLAGLVLHYHHHLCRIPLGAVGRDSIPEGAL